MLYVKTLRFLIETVENFRMSLKTDYRKTVISITIANSISAILLILFTVYLSVTLGPPAIFAGVASIVLLVPIQVRVFSRELSDYAKDFKTTKVSRF